MKKILVLLFFFFIPVVKADYQVTNYKIDMTILENGNIEVTEIFQMNGEYNGFERTIKYRNNYEGYKGNSLIVFDKQLYNGSDIVLNEIRSIEYSNKLTNEELEETSDLFNYSANATKGDYGVYKIDEFEDGESYKIYNSSKMNKDFYLNYTLKNMVITHEDVSEIMFPIFYDMEEEIDNLEININIPNNKKNLYLWVHGIDYEMTKINSQNIQIKLTNVKTENYLDFRLVFDKIDTNKMSQQYALEKIKELEDNLNIDFNDKTNKEYEQQKDNAYNLVNKAEQSLNRTDYDNAYNEVQKLNNKDELKTQLLVRLMNIEPKIDRKEELVKILLSSLLTIWIIGNIIILYHIYKKYNKKKIKYKYYKEIPNDINPIIVGYLMHKKITNDDLVASILYLINKKIIILEDKKKDYILKKGKIKKLTQSEEWLLKFIFDNKNQISLINFEHKAKNYEEFLNIYSNWLNISTSEAENYNYFEDVFSIKLIGIIYSIIGFIMCMFLINKNTYYSSIIVMIIAFISLIYFIKFYKRTSIGSLEYYKWLGFKKYIEKLYTFDSIDIPKEKYIMYSISLNCDYNLSRVVKIDDYVYDLYDSIVYAINTAYLTKKNVHSKYSSITRH